MKIIVAIVCGCLAFFNLAEGQDPSQVEATVVLSGSETYTVPSGKYGVLQQLSHNGTFAGTKLEINGKAVSNGNSDAMAGPIYLASGTVVKVSLGSSATIAVFSKFSGFPSVPINAVVVPEDQTGNFQVVLESSTDMVTWTTATAGTYTSSTTKRFFRVRVAKQ